MLNTIACCQWNFVFLHMLKKTRNRPLQLKHSVCIKLSYIRLSFKNRGFIEKDIRVPSIIHHQKFIELASFIDRYNLCVHHKGKIDACMRNAHYWSASLLCAQVAKRRFHGVTLSKLLPCLLLACCYCYGESSFNLTLICLRFTCV